MVVLLHPHRLICNPGWGKLRSSFAFMILLVIMTSFVLAIDIDFDCPDEIYVNEEFECELEIGAGDGEYDVKVDLDGERDSALRIWDGEVWKSGYYYLLEFIGNGDKKNVMLKVLETGRYEGVLKLRQGDKRESFDINMKVRPEAVSDGEQETEVGDIGAKVGEDEVIVLEVEKAEVISLNSVDDDDEEELVYISKDGRISDWLPYSFSLFLIVLIGVLIWDRH